MAAELNRNQTTQANQTGANAPTQNQTQIGKMDEERRAKALLIEEYSFWIKKLREVREIVQKCGDEELRKIVEPLDDIVGEELLIRGRLILNTARRTLETELPFLGVTNSIFLSGKTYPRNFFDTFFELGKGYRAVVDAVAKRICDKGNAEDKWRAVHCALGVGGELAVDFMSDGVKVTLLLNGIVLDEIRDTISYDTVLRAVYREYPEILKRTICR